ncbi:hypothetical protein CSUI_004734 [Cystoisospora suis]|uniref:Uncharacterized protein n=1 Tax=Cystoisospora suis TaxID=483139 RepID=A0A2C6KA60_9APIC|nr:hypothetical protein CSUI_004734 [Cystoisospora suis]
MPGVVSGTAASLFLPSLLAFGPGKALVSGTGAAAAIPASASSVPTGATALGGATLAPAAPAPLGAAAGTAIPPATSFVKTLGFWLGSGAASAPAAAAAGVSATKGASLVGSATAVGTSPVSSAPVMWPGPPDLPGTIGQVIGSGGGKVVDARAALTPSNKEAVSLVCGFLTSNAVPPGPSAMDAPSPRVSEETAAEKVDPRDDLAGARCPAESDNTTRSVWEERRAQLSTVSGRSVLYAGFLWI